MAEWSIASDCKSDAFGLRRFKSYSAHQYKKLYFKIKQKYATKENSKIKT